MSGDAGQHQCLLRLVPAWRGARSGGTPENEGAARRIHQQHGQRTADEATTKRRPGHLTLSNLHLDAKAGLGSEVQETSSYRPIANIANWWPDNVLNQDF